MEQNASLEQKNIETDPIDMILKGVLLFLLVLVVGFFSIYFFKPQWLDNITKRGIKSDVNNPQFELITPTVFIPVFNTQSPVVVTVTPTLTQTLTPSPTVINRPGEYACDPIGVCNHYIKTEGMGCPKTFSEPTCSNQCGNKDNWCKK